MTRQIGQRRVEYAAADVVKINVDLFVGTLLAQRLAHVFDLVVNRRVEAEFGDEMAALLGAADDADDAAAMTRLSPATMPTAPTETDHGLAGLGLLQM